MNELTGLVLCGGAGRRMGADKALLPAEGGPLVLSVAERLGRVVDRVLIARGDRPPLDLPYEKVDDARDAAGPLAGIVGALRVVETPLLAVVAVDMPHANPDLFSLFVYLRRGEDAVVPVDQHGSQPLHAVYARSALEPLEGALSDGISSLGQALDRLNVQYVERDRWRHVDRNGRFAFNLNSPEELVAFRASQRLRDSDA